MLCSAPCASSTKSIPGGSRSRSANVSPVRGRAPLPRRRNSGRAHRARPRSRPARRSRAATAAGARVSARRAPSSPRRRAFNERERRAPERGQLALGADEDRLACGHPARALPRPLTRGSKQLEVFPVADAAPGATAEALSFVAAPAGAPFRAPTDAPLGLGTGAPRLSWVVLDADVNLPSGRPTRSRSTARVIRVDEARSRRSLLASPSRRARAAFPTCPRARHGLVLL